ncbi:MAG: selenide, water dikinase SelD [Phycisphaerae bacterium]|nr:selenide, water dikinase SelD [Phycisphaerae bacterium]
MLAGIINKLPKTADPNLLVGMDTMDDAGVYRINDDTALVQTVDFFYPVVNDPKSFGRIVAANSLSDLWAMGARAITAMNLLSYPAGLIPPEAIEQLLIGGSEKLQEAKVSLVGGHTIEQDSMVYGMSVTGLCNPNQVLTNSKARIGDKIILTKPIGTGIYSNAHKADGLTAEHYHQFASSMERLNMYAADAIGGFDISAVTDVTGFGLLGHSLAMAKNANVTLCYHTDCIPLFDNILQYMQDFNCVGVCKCNEYIAGACSYDDNVSPQMQSLIAEAQTSGGLLIMVKADQASDALAAIQAAGDATAAIIGQVIPLEQGQNNINYLKIKR